MKKLLREYLRMLYIYIYLRMLHQVALRTALVEGAFGIEADGTDLPPGVYVCVCVGPLS